MLKTQIQQFLAANPEFSATRDDSARTASRYFYNKLAAWLKSKGSKAPSIEVVGRALGSMGFNFGVTGFPKQQRAIIGLSCGDSADYREYLAAVNARYAQRILGG